MSVYNQASLDLLDYAYRTFNAHDDMCNGLAPLSEAGSLELLAIIVGAPIAILAIGYRILALLGKISTTDFQQVR